MDIWGVVLITALLIFTNLITFALSYRKGYHKGAGEMLKQWKENNDEIKSILGAVLSESNEVIKDDKMRTSVPTIPKHLRGRD